MALQLRHLVLIILFLTPIGIVNIINYNDIGVKDPISFEVIRDLPSENNYYYFSDPISAESVINVKFSTTYDEATTIILLNFYAINPNFDFDDFLDNTYEGILLLSFSTYEDRLDNRLSENWTIFFKFNNFHLLIAVEGVDGPGLPDTHFEMEVTIHFSNLYEQYRILIFSLLGIWPVVLFVFEKYMNKMQRKKWAQKRELERVQEELDFFNRQK